MLASYTDATHGMVYANGFVYSVDGTANTVQVFDATTHLAQSPIAVGPDPFRLVTDGRYVFSINILANLGDAAVSVIDSQSQTVVHQVIAQTKPEGSDPNNEPETAFPWSAWAQGGTLFVTFPTNAVPDILPVDIGGAWTEHPLWAAGSGPGDLAGAGDTLAVENARAISNPDDDAVLLYDTSGNLLSTLETGGELQEATEVGNTAFIARDPSSGSGQLLAVDLTAGAVQAIDVCAGPYGVAAQGGSVYVMCKIDRAIDVVDASTQSVTRTIDLTPYTPAITNPRGIAVAPDGAIYIESDGMISLLQLP